MLAWNLATTESKRKPFSSVFTSLGVQIDLTKSVFATIELHNKPRRVQAIVEAVEEFTLNKSRLFGFKEALSFCGKIAFA